jgi:tetratricopeptide (TPR) repeat protein
VAADAWREVERRLGKALPKRLARFLSSDKEKGRYAGARVWGIPGFEAGWTFPFKPFGAGDALAALERTEAKRFLPLTKLDTKWHLIVVDVGRQGCPVLVHVDGARKQLAASFDAFLRGLLPRGAAPPLKRLEAASRLAKKTSFGQRDARKGARLRDELTEAIAAVEASWAHGNDDVRVPLGDAYCDLGSVEKYLGRLREAERAFEAALKIRVARGGLCLASLLIYQRRAPERALKLCRKMWAHPTLLRWDSYALFHTANYAAYVLLQLGRPADARHELERILENCKDDPEKLDDAEKDLRELTAAKASYSAAAEETLAWFQAERRRPAPAAPAT